MPTPDPDKGIIIVDDDGSIYKLEENQWKKKANKLENPAAIGVIQELTQLGSAVAFVRRDFAVGFGTCCFVLNLGAIKH